MAQFLKFEISVDKDMVILNAPDTFYGYVGSDSVKKFDQLIPPQDMIQLKNSLFALNPGRKGLCCFRVRTAGGVLNWIAANIRKSDDKEGRIDIELIDIQSMNEKSPMAQYDAMTGLMNKQAITDYAVSLTRLYPRKTFYFVLLDIDHFKNVNDLFGHMCGDEVITDVAHIIRDCVGEIGQVGRIGGDEFMAVLDNVDRNFKIREVLADIRETVEDKYKGFRGELDITVSIGCVLYPDYAMDYDELFMLTDKMLYRAKMKGRNRYILYTPEIHGDLKAAPITNVTTRQVSSETSKIHLITSYMESFLKTPNIPIRMAIEEVLKIYELDELYVYFDDVKCSRHGIKRSSGGDDKTIIEDVEKAMPILKSKSLQEKFDDNNTAVLNIFDLKHGADDELIEYLEEEKLRFMMVYNMTAAKKGGYVVYRAESESNCRLSESDISDLIYFSRMLELTSLER